MFDHTRYDWYPTVFYNGVSYSATKVVNSDGTPRPPLAIPLKTFTVHYGGAGQWLDPGDTHLELAAIERNHAIPSKKPNEYNSASDSDSATWEWAGKFRAAHSAGENETAWGHLVVLGLEQPTEAQATKLIAGIRRARQQCVDAGWLTADHAVVAHQNMPDANTNCPGPLYTNKSWWNQIIAPLTPPQPTPPPPAVGEDVLVNIVYYNNEPAHYAQYSGGYKIWIPDEATEKVLLALNPGVKATSLNGTWMQAAGPILPGTPLPYGGAVDAYGRKT